MWMKVVCWLDGDLCVDCVLIGVVGTVEGGVQDSE